MTKYNNNPTVSHLKQTLDQSDDGSVALPVQILQSNAEGAINKNPTVARLEQTLSQAEDGSMALPVEIVEMTPDGSTFVRSELPSSGGEPTLHNHDDRYYQKSEVDNEILTTKTQLEQEQYKLKATPNDAEPSYLDSKVDGVTAEIINNKVVVKNINGLTVGVSALNNWLSGTDSNIQNQINGMQTTIQALAGGMKYKGKFETRTDLDAVSNLKNGDLAVVLVDESHSDGRSLYIYSENIGAWDFVGGFEFSDEFIALSDTPNSYVGHSGEYVKVDENSGKVVFSTVDYSELSNIPSSDVSSIDQAVTQRHTHTNKANLDKLNINPDGELTIDGVVYTPKKQSLYARVGSNDITIANGANLVFDQKVSGDIPYDTSTGEFTLEEGKLYVIHALLNVNVGKSFTHIYLHDAATKMEPVEGGARATINSTNFDSYYTSGGFLSAMIKPTSTRKFILRKHETQGKDNNYLGKYSSSLIIHEI